MRLFIATPVYLKNYDEIKNKLSFLKAKWVENENLHITHKFIGEDNVENWKIDLKIPNEFIKIDGFGIFNNKILYLKATSKHINIIANQLNVKNFIPHITICRLKQMDNSVFEVLQNINIDAKIPFEVYLYSSILTKNGPIYKKIYKY